MKVIIGLEKEVYRHVSTEGSRPGPSFWSQGPPEEGGSFVRLTTDETLLGTHSIPSVSGLVSALGFTSGVTRTKRIGLFRWTKNQG